GWGQDPPAVALTLASGLAEVAAIGLDRAFRTVELHRTIAELDRRRTEWARTETLRQLGQMSAVVAHEVKNPLASMSAVMQVLRTRFADGSQEKDILSKLLERVAELSRMVDELLAFARPRTPNWTTVAVAPLLAEVASTLRQDEAYRAVEVRIEAEASTVRADRGMLQRLLLNLVLNAAQATDGRGTVTLAARPARDGLEISVSDDGPGVPPELVDKVFEPFVTTRTRGSGLGLAIARQVAESHGGQLSYRPAVRGGACFAVTLPSTGG
ncbi:MAG: ATP-binding protein, partial [Myxococcota bacterium]